MLTLDLDYHALDLHAEILVFNVNLLFYLQDLTKMESDKPITTSGTDPTESRLTTDWPSPQDHRMTVLCNKKDNCVDLPPAYVGGFSDHFKWKGICDTVSPNSTGLYQ